MWFSFVARKNRINVKDLQLAVALVKDVSKERHKKTKIIWKFHE